MYFLIFFCNFLHFDLNAESVLTKKERMFYRAEKEIEEKWGKNINA